VVDRARLESVCTERYRGFESLSLRQIKSHEPIPHSGIFHFYRLAKQDEVLSERACKNENIRNEVEDGS
jgi:hypothetical protein